MREEWHQSAQGLSSVATRGDPWRPKGYQPTSTRYQQMCGTVSVCLRGQADAFLFGHFMSLWSQKMNVEICWNMLKYVEVIWIPKYVQVMDQQLFSFSDVSKIKHFYSKTSPLSSMHLASFSLQMPSDCWFPPCFLPIALAPFKFLSSLYLCISLGCC